LLGITDDRDRKKTYTFFGRLKGKGTPPTLEVDERIILKLILQKRGKGGGVRI
jgi:hypothetical protein